jgi:stress-induced morphogen
MDEFLWLKKLIGETLPDARVEVEDMTGTKDHLALTIVSTQFANKSLIEQHRMVMNILAEPLKKQIHAVKLKTFTPDKYPRS